MHLMSREHRAAASGIVGASGPTACGFALAEARRGSEGLAVAFFGEGAMNQGQLLESINLASAWKLPVLFVCKDNGWAITTRSAEMTGGSLDERVRGLGAEVIEVDGGDARACWQAGEAAVGRVRSGRGPIFLHASCYRPDGHFLGDPLLRVLDRPMEEAREMTGPLLGALGARGGTGPMARVAGLGRVVGTIASAARNRFGRRQDPIPRGGRIGTDEFAAAIESEREQVEQALERAVSRADASREFEPARTQQPSGTRAAVDSPPLGSASMSYAEAIEASLAHEMAADESIVVFGEDVPLLRRNLLARFGPERVWGAPISESAFLGAGVGAAMAGLRPVVEIMLVDFLGVCFDALLNHAAKTEAFSNGSWTVPLVVRCACGGGYGDGGQHEQALWGLLAQVPGLSVVAPSNPADAAGLMRAAIEHDGPVVYLEHKLLSDYWRDYLGGDSRSTVEFDLPESGVRGQVADPPERVELGRARVVRSGSDLTLVTVGVGVHRSLAAAEQLATEGVEAGVVDLRSVSPLDRQTVVESVRSTGRVLVVDEDYREFGLSGEIAALLAEAGVAAKYGRVATEGTIPYARHLEDEALPNVARIRTAVRALLD
jgi:pyruvate dehydrogenase E1 component beta subunit